MFGLGKKKPEPPQRPGRSRVSDGNKEKNKAETRAQLNLFGVPGLGDDVDLDVRDDDLEDELLALLGEAPPSSKSRGLPPRPSRPGIQKPSQPQPTVIDPFSMSNYDVDIDSGGDDDDDVDDADLEAELGELTGNSHPVQASFVQVPQTTSTISKESMVQTLEERLVMYQKAKAKSDAVNDSGKSRRFTRGIKTLEDLLKKAKLGKVIDEQEIPPVVALGESRNEGTRNSSSHDFSDNMRPQPVIPEDLPPIQTFEPIPQIPYSKPPVYKTTTPEPLISLESSQPVPSPVPLIVDPLVESRLKDYKKMAVLLKRSGDSQSGMEYLKLAKTLEAAIKSGAPVDLSIFPGIPEPSQPKSEEPIQEKLTPPQVSESQSETTTENMTLPNEFFAGPDAPKTIMEALQQRLDKYKSEVEKATSESNSSKARRMGRIVKQYEDAITLYKKGKPVPYDELPTPPGFGPIPVPGASGGTVAAIGGGVGPSSANSDTPPSTASSLNPSQPMVSGVSPTPKPVVGFGATTDVSPPKAPQKPSPNSAVPKAGSITRGGKPVVKLTLQEKQLSEILKRQAMFREAALNAKKLGDVNQAKEFLRTARGFDKLIEASKSGLPVDMNTLPSAPEAVASLDFELVSGEDCVEVTGSTAEIFAKLEGDLKNQLKVCMSTRAHYKTIGDIASANRFESMALESKRDLDILRLAAKQGGAVPKYTYETRIFSITECNTDLNEGEIEINILQGINYKVQHPDDVDTFVKVELAYPSAEEVQVNKTSVIKDTNNPTYNATFKMTINRTARNFQRFVHSKGVKCEVYSKGGFLRGSTLIGVANAKLQGLETKCVVHDAFEIIDGRKSVGKLEVKLRLRDPVLLKQITQKKEKWVSIKRV